MAKQHSRNTIRDLVQLISFLILVGMAVKKLMQLAKQWEEGSKQQGLVSDTIKKNIPPAVFNFAPTLLSFVKEATKAPVTVPAKSTKVDMKKFVVEPMAKPAVKAAVKQKTPAKMPALNLTSRQEQIFNLLRDKGSLNMAALTKKFNEVSSRTLRRDLTALEDLGLIMQSGKTKSSVYTLK